MIKKVVTASPTSTTGSSNSVWISVPSRLDGLQNVPHVDGHRVSKLATMTPGTTGGFIVPDFWNWRAGDVLLFRRARKLSRSSAIVVYQQMTSIAGVGSEATHVAIYDGVGGFWDIMPGEHVRQKSIWQIFRDGGSFGLSRWSQHPVNVDRLYRALNDFKVQKYKIFDIKTLELMQKRTKKTSVGSRKAIDFDVNYSICSTFIEKLLFFSNKIDVFADLPIALPGDYIDSANFTSLTINWFQSS